MKMTIKRHRRVTKHRKHRKGTTKGTTKPRKSIRRIKNRKLKTRRQSGGGYKSFINADANITSNSAKGIDVKVSTELHADGNPMSWLIGGDGFFDATFSQLRDGAKDRRYQAFIAALENDPEFEDQPISFFTNPGRNKESSKGIKLNHDQFCRLLINGPLAESYPQLRENFNQKKYTCAESQPQSQVEQLVAMGFNKEDVKNALKSAGGNIQTAVAMLLSAAASENSARPSARGGVVEAQSSAQKATIRDFLNAQSGILPPQLGGGGCTTYAQALSEINEGQKKTCWIWYILPSSPGDSATSKFFGIGPARVNPEQYLSDPTLSARYVEMLNAIGAKLSEYLLNKLVKIDHVKPFLVHLMGGNSKNTVDYDKLKKSLSIFSNALEKPVSGNIELLASLLGVQLYAPPPGPPPTVQYVAPSSAPPQPNWVAQLETMGFTSDQIDQALSAGKTNADDAIVYMLANPLPERYLPVENLSFEPEIGDLMVPNEFVEKYARAYGLQFDEKESYQPDTRGRNLTQFAANTNCPDVANWTVMQTIGDGNCLTHAFLQCMSSSYRKIHVDNTENPVEKSAVAQAFRLAFARINDPRFLLDKYPKIMSEFKNENGRKDLGEGTYAFYAALFNVILVVFDIPQNTIMVANLNEQTAIPKMPVIFIHGDGTHYSSVFPPIPSLPSEPFVLHYEHTDNYNCLKQYLSLDYPVRYNLYNLDS
jgi:uncharacterized protein (DUF1810 family)